MIFRPLMALVAKDLRVFFSERHTIVLSFAAPIALASFMAAIFGGAGPSASSRISIVLVDEDQSVISASIAAGAGADDRLRVEPSTRLDGLARVRTGRAVAAVVIPKGFGEAASGALLGDGRPPELIVYHDPTRRSEVSLAQGLLTRVVLEAVSAESLGDLGGDLIGDLKSGPVGSAVDRDESVDRAGFLGLFDLGRSGPTGEDASIEADREEFARAFPGLGDWVKSEVGEPPKPKGGLRMPYESREVSITQGGPEGERGALAAHAFAGMVVQFVLFSAIEWGVGLLVERRRGLWKRLRVAPVSRTTLIAGKVLGCVASSTLIIAAVFGFGLLAFRFPVRGDWLALILMGVAFAWMAANFGLMVASLGRSPQGARSVSILAVLAMVMLGGGWIPGFLFPEWLQQLTPVIPARWAIEGFDAVFSRGYTLAEVAPTLLVLVGFGAGFGVVALVTFGWSEPG